MKKNLNTNLIALFLLFMTVMPQRGSAQLKAHFSINAFNTPQNQPFIETYLTFIGSSLAARVVEGGVQSSVNLLLTIYKDTTIVKASKYFVHGPVFSDSVSSPSFIDVQRYSLPNGTYKVELSITDKYALNPKPTVFTEVIRIDYNTKDIQSSGIEVLESYKKSTTPGVLSKSGYDLIPYCINYYPETSKELAFYFEGYNTDTVFGKNRPFIFYYYLETSQNFTKLNSYGSFKKQIASKVNPLLTKLDISGLGSGNYNLVIEIKDEKNITHLQRKFYFQRLNKSRDIAALQLESEANNLAEYFGACNNPDTLQMFVECLWPIANGVDKERTINQSLKKNPEMMKKFIVDFWQRRAADTANPIKLWGAYYKKVQEVMVLFKCGKQKGYYTERGRVYLQYGKPDQRSIQNYEPNTYPYEIWQYYRLVDNTNGQFFTNRRFVFVNRNLGDDCHTLIHSDVRGEINNDRWRFEVTRRNNNGAGNIDNTQPTGVETNQFNEIYANPR